MDIDNSELESLRIGDVYYPTKLTDAFKKRVAYKTPDLSNQLSFIPGTISDIRVKKGDKVKEGDILMHLEAMKMKNRVLAPFDGIVGNINVKEGEIVPKNFLMVSVEKS
jgi:pyruvate carboxylase subunit B